MDFFEIFKKTNDYDEKTIIGALAFIILVVYAVSDIVAGFLGKPFDITEFIFDGFLFITLGAFAISAGQYFSKNNKQSENKTDGEQ